MDLDNNRWKICKSRLRELLPSDCGSNWLDALLLVKITSNKVTFAGIPHELHRLDIKNNHENHIRSALVECYPEFGSFALRKFEYAVGTKIPTKAAIQEEFSFEESKNEKNSANNSSNLQGVTQKKIIPVANLPTIGPCRFSNFVICEFNQLVFKAAEQVLLNPARNFNPFFIYGGEGTGKSYLLQALAEEWLKEHSGSKVVMLNAENFLNQFIQDIRRNQMAQFRDKFRNPDILIMEDVQVLSSSPQCQQELKHTITALKESGKQVILSANNLPSRITGLNSTLASKLESGLSLDLPAPDRRSCLKILQSKAKELRIELTEEISHYLIRNLSPNICQLEGILIRLGAHSSLMGEKISLDLVKKLINNLVDKETESQQTAEKVNCHYENSEENIIRQVCTSLRLSSTDIKSGRRDQRVVKGRQFIAYLLTEDLGMSLNQIGHLLGRSHSTVHNALKNAQKSMEVDEVYRRQVFSIRKEISSFNEEQITNSFSESGKENLFSPGTISHKIGLI
jgi:chromosomal replication initiator protein